MFHYIYVFQTNLIHKKLVNNFCKVWRQNMSAAEKFSSVGY